LADNITGILIFHRPNTEQLEHIKTAERELLKAGVRFDVLNDYNAKRMLKRRWQFDWSLAGAKLVNDKES